MPTVDAYRRAPLVNPAFVPFSDASLQVGGLHGQMTRQVLDLADIPSMSPLDAVIASKLGGFSDLPPVPDVAAAADQIQSNPKGFIALARATLMTAAFNQDKNAILQLLAAMRAFLEALPALPEQALLPIGADALRLCGELYRRTGQPFLLTILERLRAQLPDVSGLMHAFPFTKAYQADKAASLNPETADYHRRMDQLATGNLTADALAITALFALFSGSSRDGAAGRTGLTALQRYHGVATGAFSADPYLAGRDPARAADLPALCAQVEALCDLLAASGDLTLADRLESLMVNALPDLVTPRGVRTLEPVNRLPGDDSCAAQKPESQDTSALMRALYALRRTVWMAKENDEIALLLPVSSGCLTRVAGVPVRLTAEVAGTVDQTVSITVEAKQPVNFTLLLRVPSYVSDARVVVAGGREQTAPAGTLFPVRRTFRTGDTVLLRLTSLPRLEAGYRGSASVLCGPTLLCLPLPDEGAGWQFALVDGAPLTALEEEGGLTVLAVATDAPTWREKSGFITPPPQGISAGMEYELTLIPFGGTQGRIAAFPRAVRRG